MGTIAATIFILTCIIVATTPCIIVKRAILYNRAHQYPVGARAYMSEIYPHLKTGDILLFRGISPLPHRYVTGALFEHAAVLLREGELIYISEIEPGGARLMPDPDTPGAEIHMAPGVNATPLLARVKYYNGIIYVMRLSRALDAGPPPGVAAAHGCEPHCRAVIHGRCVLHHGSRANGCIAGGSHDCLHQAGIRHCGQPRTSGGAGSPHAGDVPAHEGAAHERSQLRERGRVCRSTLYGLVDGTRACALHCGAVEDQGHRRSPAVGHALATRPGGASAGDAQHGEHQPAAGLAACRYRL